MNGENMFDSIDDMIASMGFRNATINSKIRSKLECDACIHKHFKAYKGRMDRPVYDLRLSYAVGTWIQDEIGGRVDIMCNSSGVLLITKNDESGLKVQSVSPARGADKQICITTFLRNCADVFGSDPAGLQFDFKPCALRDGTKAAMLCPSKSTGAPRTEKRAPRVSQPSIWGDRNA